MNWHDQQHKYFSTLPFFAFLSRVKWFSIAKPAENLFLCSKVTNLFTNRAHFCFPISFCLIFTRRRISRETVNRKTGEKRQPDRLVTRSAANVGSISPMKVTWCWHRFGRDHGDEPRNRKRENDVLSWIAFQRVASRSSGLRGVISTMACEMTDGSLKSVKP